MTHQDFLFHRPDLAHRYADSLEGRSLVDASSGLFLAAPRRTGKTTFVRQDLLPTLVARGATPVYVDLWADRSRDPALLISSAIQSKLQEFASTIRKLAQVVGSAQINLFGTVQLGLAQPELPAAITLADALEALSVAAQTPVALVIDEAQHALLTPEGRNAMFALKAARDRLSHGVTGPRLKLVMTGSNRDKLAYLVRDKDQPFFGGTITHFPLLGKEFLEAFAAHINRFLAADNQFEAADLWEAFRLVGYRPEMLRRLVANLALDGGAERLRVDLRTGAHNLRSQIWGQMEAEFSGLTPIQRAVLETLIETGAGCAPFSDTFLKTCAQKLGRTAKLPAGTVQGALDALREKNLVWRADWGDYALEDESMAEWYLGRSTETS
ncbi:ATP-binding protein [Thiomonas sp.]